MTLAYYNAQYSNLYETYLILSNILLFKNRTKIHLRGNYILNPSP